MNAHRSARHTFAGVVAALAVAAAAPLGCSSNSSLAPYQPQITNAPDNFQFQATGVSNVTQTFTYSWSNSGTGASVNQATTTTAGSATITVSDNGGTQVYTKDLSANGTFSTSTGVTGTWTIKVVFAGYSGTVNFRVQKM